MPAPESGRVRVARPPHAEAIDDLLTRIGADPKGLTSAEARARLEKDGKNELPPPPRPSAIKRFFAQFANPIVLTLLVAAVIALVEAHHRVHEPALVRYGDAIAILLIVALNAVLGFYQEQRAEAALDALQKMQTPNARVHRDGKVVVVPAGELVVGDVLDLEAGDAIAADARVVYAANLAAEESVLTGESVPVGKDATAAVAEDAPIGDRTNMLFVGTSIVRGKARAIVTATATRTELGKLSVLIHSIGDRKTPLEDKLDAFGKQILWVCLGLSVLIFARGLIKGDRSWHELLLEAVSLAVAAIPEGLPAITTITLALGMQRMAKRGAIVRKLAAVETLGAATVICSDKTGTLTQNEMTVREAFAGHVRYEITGVGYDPTGEIKADGKKIAPDSGGSAGLSKPLRHLLEIGALCNNASLEQNGDDKWIALGDPTEAALLTLAAKAGVQKDALSETHKLLKELPFDSDRKRMTVLTLDAKGREVAHSKGSADVLLPLCSSLEMEDGVKPLTEDDRKKILEHAEEMSRKSLRVLAVARRVVSEKQIDGEADKSDHELEDQLTFIGLVGMIDPPREGVKEAIAACTEAGVRAVMITGDHKLTAVAIAQELGLWEKDALAVTGADLEKLDDAALEAKVDHVRVFARVTAEQKLRIVKAYKAGGHVVAMTGDGVNDAPALREAHIGVAMGKNGTDVARQAADMVIADDNFATIVEAVREGRAIYRNIQKFIFFLLSSNAGLLVAVFVGSFMSLPPLTPLMILWINLVTNGLPALALGIDPPDPTQMQEPPRKAKGGLLHRREYLDMAFVGVWMGAAALLVALWPWGEIGGPGRFEERAAAFSLLAISPLFHAFNCRSATFSIFQLHPKISKPLLIAVLASGAIHLVSVAIPSLRPVFRTFPMMAMEWLIVILLSASIIPAIEALKAIRRASASRA
ncbi:MAG: cation-translocating P-type ATPase [Polyangiaceae bacterium]